LGGLGVGHGKAGGERYEYRGQEQRLEIEAGMSWI
jgi:hypothetical protein